MARGGARDGAGAPPAPEDKKKKSITLTLDQSDIDWVKSQKRKGAAIISAFIKSKEAEGKMQYFGQTDKSQYLTDKKYIPMAKIYWGQMPLPMNSELVGGYSDKNRAGALIKMQTGIYVCGNAGTIANIPQPEKNI